MGKRGEPRKKAPDGDTWWYVCTTCNQAFPCDLGLRAHNWVAHKAKGLANVQIMSQVTDLAPVLRIERCGGPFSPGGCCKDTKYSDLDRICPHCLLPFGSQEGLRVHVLLTHAHAPTPASIPIASNEEKSTSLLVKAERAIDEVIEDEASVSEGASDLLSNSSNFGGEEHVVELVDEKPMQMQLRSRSRPQQMVVQIPADEDSDSSGAAEEGRGSESDSNSNGLTSGESADSDPEYKPDYKEDEDKDSQDHKESERSVSPPIYHKITLSGRGNLKMKRRRRRYMRAVDGAGNECKRKGCKLCPTLEGLKSHKAPPMPCPEGEDQEECEAELGATAGLKEHARGTEQSEINGNLPCPQCGKLFKTKATLTEHERGTHAKTRPFKCGKCNATLKSKKILKQHMVCHSDRKPCACPQCPKYYKSPNGVRRHLRKTHQRCICQVCAQEFVGTAARDRHELRAHQFRGGDNRKVFKCEYEGCGKIFIHASELKVHQVSHGNERPFICETCGLAFKSNGRLRVHRTIHIPREEWPHVCDVEGCGRRFSDRSLMALHKKRIHEGIKQVYPPDPCRVCGKVCTSKWAAMNHELRVHDFQRGARPFKECTTCGKKFPTQSLLKTHERRHGDVRSIICETCGKGFKSKPNLDQHQMTHVPYEELPHVCEVCGKRFGWAKSVREHKEKHHGVGAKKRAKAKQGSETETEEESEESESETTD